MAQHHRCPLLLTDLPTVIVYPITPAIMPARAFTLMVEDMTDPGRSEEYSFEQAAITIGRARSNDLMLLNRHRTVSRQHAEIRWEDDAFRLVDLGSKNSTHLNGQRLESARPYPLRHGDRFQVGDFEIELAVATARTASCDVDLFCENPQSLLTKLYGNPDDRPGGTGLIDVAPRRAVQELIALSELAFDVGRTFTLTDSIHTVLDRTLRAVHADHGTLLLLDERAPDSHQCFSRSAVPDEALPALGPGLLEGMQRHKRPLRLTPATSGPPGLDLPWSESLRSVLCMPLVVRTRLIGLLTVYNAPNVTGFTEADERLVVLIAAQAAQMIENVRLHEQARELEQARRLAQAYEDLEEAHRHLKATQTQLIQREKMASLGALTAGIAHEMRNPLNFITNFSEVLVELIEELDGLLNPQPGASPGDVSDDVRKTLADLKQNAERIVTHSNRAEGIVAGMMQHARGTPGTRETVALNALVEEYATLALHCAQAKEPGFSVSITHAFDESVGAVELVPRDVGTVLVNLFNNAFDAVRRRARADDTFEPAIRVATRTVGGHVDVLVEDNGPGIPDDLREKIFEPFFTTKATGEGTGLGLSISYDIVVQGHGGLLSVETPASGGARFVVCLPLEGQADVLHDHDANAGATVGLATATALPPFSPPSPPPDRSFQEKTRTIKNLPFLRRNPKNT